MIFPSFVSFQLMGIVLFLAAISCIVSLLCSLYMGYLDKRKQEALHTEALETGEQVSLWDIKDFPLRFVVVCPGRNLMGTLSFNAI